MTKKVVLFFSLLLLLIIGFELFVLFGPKKPTTSKISYACPVPTQYCKQGKVIKVNGKYFGLGYTLPVDTPIYAIINGQTRGGRTSFSPQIGKGTYPNIILYNFETNYEVVYILTNNDYQGLTDVKKAAQIDRSRQGKIANYDYNLILKIYNKDNNQLIEVDNNYFNP